MAKGGYQKRRLEEKKQREREARKRARRNKKIATVVASLLVLGLIGAIVGIAVSGDEGLVSDDPTPTPEPFPTAEFAEPCTAPDDVADGQKTFDDPPCKIIDDGVDYTATVETSKGTLEVDLLETDAPVTVNNFVFLARQGFYDDSIFHRVIPDFAGSAMIQGGDAVNRNGTGDPGYSFGDENLIPFDQGGYLAMANSGPGTNGSQFFFLDGTVPHLNAPGSCPGPSGCHSIFGVVTAGMDVIGEIAGVKRGANDMPNKDVVITKVTIHEAA